jgi:hypothetical protein
MLIPGSRSLGVSLSLVGLLAIAAAPPIAQASNLDNGAPVLQASNTMKAHTIIPNESKIRIAASGELSSRRSPR